MMKNSFSNFQRNLSLLLIALVLSPIILAAQIDIRFNHLKQQRLKLQDVLNVTINYSGSQDQEVILIGEIKDQSLKKLCFIKSSPLAIHPGINMIYQNKLKISQLDYFDDKIRKIVNRSGYFPSGIYQICVSAQNPSSFERVGPFCEITETNNMQPPRLVLPIDKSVLHTSYPYFSWLPPSPILPGEEVVYSMKLTRILDGQSPIEAIQSNPYIIKADNLKTQTLQYPISAVKLNVSSEYVWQIEAFIGGNSVGKTEIWTFKFSQSDSTQQKDLEKLSGTYVALTKEIRANPYLAIGAIFFKFDGQYNKRILSFKILDHSRKDITPEHLVLQENHGDNRYIIKLGNSQFKNDEIYYLEVVNQKREKFYLKFKYINNEK